MLKKKRIKAIVKLRVKELIDSGEKVNGKLYMMYFLRTDGNMTDK
jgi:hypothetical protein